MCVAAAPLPRLCPDGEELRGQIARTRGVEIQVAALERVVEVPGSIREALGCVGVSVNNDRGAVDFG